MSVIDEVFARRYFPNADPIGKRFSFGDSSWITIVGVVGHAAHEGLDAEPRIQYYFPNTQRQMRNMTAVIRTAGDPLSMLPAARAAVR